ncbi:hypothetical protein AKJ13_20850 [Methylobacterium sp. ARG-1]|nr:hypothetical protein AKJ13_20850 [Methylobacterium sp. ARG-1]
MRVEMEALADGIISIEAWANELAEAATELSDQPGAKALLTMLRQKRVQALERRGQLAALREEYTARFHPKQ